MKHSSSRRLFDYWNRRRGARAAPERGEIEPAAIRSILGDTFILAYGEDGNHHFRLAGTKVCALFCRELKGTSFIGLWERKVQARMRDLIEIVSDESVGFVAGVTAQSAKGDRVELELLLLPLTYRGESRARLLGVLAPFAVPYWLGVTPLEAPRIASLRHLGPAVDLAGIPAFAVPDGRPRRGLVVYEGGRPE